MAPRGSRTLPAIGASAPNSSSRGNPGTLVAAHPGNANAVRHGAHSPRLIQARAAEIATELTQAHRAQERRLTRARDIFPVWGRRWIAFSRYPKSRAYARRIWRIRPNGNDAQPVTAPPPPRFARNGYYGLDPIDWTPDERLLLAGLASEWGPEAIRVDVATGAFRKLSGYALDLRATAVTARELA